VGRVVGSSTSDEHRERRGEEGRGGGASLTAPVGLPTDRGMQGHRFRTVSSLGEASTMTALSVGLPTGRPGVGLMEPLGGGCAEQVEEESRPRTEWWGRYWRERKKEREERAREAARGGLPTERAPNQHVGFPTSWDGAPGEGSGGSVGSREAGGRSSGSRDSRAQGSSSQLPAPSSQLPAPSSQLPAPSSRSHGGGTVGVR
jgi:hypothetical protein